MENVPLKAKHHEANSLSVNKKGGWARLSRVFVLKFHNQHKGQAQTQIQTESWMSALNGSSDPAEGKRRLGQNWWFCDCKDYSSCACDWRSGSVLVFVFVQDKQQQQEHSFSLNQKKWHKNALSWNCQQFFKPPPKDEGASASTSPTRWHHVRLNKPPSVFETGGW